MFLSALNLSQDSECICFAIALASLLKVIPLPLSDEEEGSR